MKNNFAVVLGGQYIHTNDSTIIALGEAMYGAITKWEQDGKPASLATGNSKPVPPAPPVKKPNPFQLVT